MNLVHADQMIGATSIASSEKRAAVNLYDLG